MSNFLLLKQCFRELSVDNALKCVHNWGWVNKNVHQVELRNQLGADNF